MSLRQFVALMASMVLAMSATQAQTSVRVRGTITAVDGNVLSVKSREGRDLKITLADNVAVLSRQGDSIDEIKPGDKLGVTSMPGAGWHAGGGRGALPSAWGSQGQGPWDLQPGSTTNASVVPQSVAGTGNREIDLAIQGKTQKVAVPEERGTRARGSGSRSDLVASEYVFTVAQGADDQT